MARAWRRWPGRHRDVISRFPRPLSLSEPPILLPLDPGDPRRRRGADGAQRDAAPPHRAHRNGGGDSGALPLRVALRAPFPGARARLSRRAASRPDAAFFVSIALGAAAQILATALMLAAMRERSFSVVTATSRPSRCRSRSSGSPCWAIRSRSPVAAAILVATAGVVLLVAEARAGSRSGARPALFGIAAGGPFFALAAIGFRGAILSLDGGSFLIRATTTLAWGLGSRRRSCSIWLASLFDRPALIGSFRVWRLVPRGRLPRRARVAVLVHRLCADDGRQRAHARPRRGPDGAGRLAPASSPKEPPARGCRDRPDRRRRRAPADGPAAGAVRLRPTRRRLAPPAAPAPARRSWTTGSLARMTP